MIRVHLWRELVAVRPGLECDLRGLHWMHLMTGNAGEVATFETGRFLHAVHLAPRHSDHPVAPETIVKKIGLGRVDEILLRGVILFVRLNDEALHQILLARTKLSALPVPI